MLNVVITSFEIAMNDRPHFQNLKYVFFFYWTSFNRCTLHRVCVCYVRWFLQAIIGIIHGQIIWWVR
jgi:hypothetical protein